MRHRLILLLALCLLLCSCQPSDPITPLLADTDLPVPAPAVAQVVPREAEVTLWFRLDGQPVLAPETRMLDLSPTAPFELTLLQALASGPAAASTELSGLFPPGTKVLSTHVEGRTLFVTMSRQIMNSFSDEPAAWAAQPDWADEVPLRRLLAMQAIAATVTENCDVDSIVILVEQTDSGSGSLRLRESYYRSGGDASALAAPLTRDESMLLTPGNTIAMVLTCWQTRDWAQLYPFVTRTDPATGEARPAYDAFAAQMAELPHLTGFTASAGSVSADGQSAVFTVTLTFLEDGQSRTVTGTLRLHRERGLWRVGLSQLEEREGDLP